MEGTHGVRKMPSRRARKEWRHSRHLYYYHDELMPLYLLALFSKGDKANLTKAERNELAGLVDILVNLWKERNVMSTAFKSIKQGRQEAIAHAKGEQTGVCVHRPRPVDVKVLRAKVGMTQEQFAACFGFSSATLRHWERGDRTPHGPALVLLNVIERNPKAVIDALA